MQENEIDLSRIYHLEDLRRGFMGAYRGHWERVEDLRHRIADIERRKKHAIDGKEETSRGRIETVTEGYSVRHGWVSEDETAATSWDRRINEFDQTITGLKEQLEDAQAAYEVAFEKFNETGHLVDNCKKFLRETFGGTVKGAQELARRLEAVSPNRDVLGIA